MTVPWTNTPPKNTRHATTSVVSSNRRKANIEEDVPGTLHPRPAWDKKGANWGAQTLNVVSACVQMRVKEVGYHTYGLLRHDACKYSASVHVKREQQSRAMFPYSQNLEFVEVVPQSLRHGHQLIRAQVPAYIQHRIKPGHQQR